MVYVGSPPSPTSTTSSIELKQPLRFLGAGKQFYAFETADGNYVVKFMKWSRRRPLPWLEHLPFHTWVAQYLAARAHRSAFLQKSSRLALDHLSQETKLAIPAPVPTWTLIDKLGISHTVDSRFTHFYVQRKALSFTHYFQTHPSEATPLLRSFIHTVAAQCQQGICNLDPVIDRNYGVVVSETPQVILLDIGSFLASPKLHHSAAVHQEIILELLPLRAWLQSHHPQHLPTFDALLGALPLNFFVTSFLENGMLF